MSFQKGDRVEATVNAPAGNPEIHIGDLGKICCINGKSKRVGVRWDMDSRKGHDCGGRCDDGHGWYVFYTSIRRYNKDESVEIDESSFMRMIKS